MIPDEAQIGVSLTRIVADRGYRGHNAPPDHKFRVYISGQRRRVTEAIKREPWTITRIFGSQKCGADTIFQRRFALAMNRLLNQPVKVQFDLGYEFRPN